MLHVTPRSARIALSRISCQFLGTISYVIVRRQFRPKKKRVWQYLELCFCLPECFAVYSFESAAKSNQNPHISPANYPPIHTFIIFPQIFHAVLCIKKTSFYSSKLAMIRSTDFDWLPFITKQTTFAQTVAQMKCAEKRVALRIRPNRENRFSFPAKHAERTHQTV